MNDVFKIDLGNDKIIEININDANILFDILAKMLNREVIPFQAYNPYFRYINPLTYYSNNTDINKK